MPVDRCASTVARCCRCPLPELQSIRGGVVGYVFQEPGASLNPVQRVGRQILEAIQLHKPERATDAEVVRLLKLVGIPAPRVGRATTRTNSAAGCNSE